MFVHRGLAPYRCELCTNLYNMKRLLIRHYKTVHKRMPTRDMVQAKGDKITVARSNKETIQAEVNKDPMLMCAKCPFECESDADMKKHLNAHHGINDGVSVHANEVFIIRKLPFECPRCIRSFAAKRTLTRHLQRSHLVDTIIELKSPAPTITPNETQPNAETNETVPLHNAEDATADKETDTPLEAPVADDTAMAAPVADDTAMAAPVADDTAMAAPVVNDTAVVPVAADTSMGAASANAEIDGINVAECDGYTPAAEVLPSHVLNGSDKLLTAATMEPSPIKDGRTRLPRTPIFVCKLCNKTFDELSKLAKHETDMHSGGEPRRVVFQHKCSTCLATFRTLTLLKFHMKRHLARRYQCNRCPKCFIKKPELERHILMKHAEKHDMSSKDKAFRCSLDGCTKTFNFKHHLVRHQNAVHLKVRHVCNICGKDMVNSFNLRAHMRIHSGNGQSYKCPNCDKTYVRRGPLRLHARQAHQLELTDSDWAKMLCNNVRSNNLHVKKTSRKKKTVEAPEAGD
ncbi:zinc finger protein 658B isoform X2 [Drosophila tropicalis]|uniref:zinc finger protein 658B isoform X2 n=1 Tax=Drosophila tropicalis TaxID=46794 RepID=UPI0035ABB26C